jgi:ribulose-5-phosphate 4-epimerase/fuculose-1-phosphate aldolase
MEKVYVSEKLKEEFAFWSREIARKGLVNCSSGNISFRLNKNYILISQTGCWLENLTAANISVIETETGVNANNVKPSGEWKLHTAIYKQRPDINVILHFQSPDATTLACVEKKPDYNAIIEIPIYIGNVAHVPFLMPGSVELAEAVALQSVHHNVIQLSNHGQVALGKKYEEVFERAVFFELNCSIIVKAGIDFNPIPELQLPLLENYRQK